MTAGESCERERRLPCIWLVIPCFNEEQVLPDTIPMFLAELDSMVASGKASPQSCALFVNDGSSDSTWRVISEAAASDGRVRGLSLSRNCGHQSALMAGLMEARPHCDAVISMDCDGQDDIAAASKMVEEYLGGADVVYGVRSNRDSDTRFKRSTAEGFYRLMNKMGAEVVFNHADYRLMSARALDGLAEFGEANLFLRGLVPLVGFESAQVPYERHERIAGSSHYPLRKMVSLAIDGITSLSAKPLRVVMGVGAAFFVLGIAAAIWAVVTAVTGNSVAGWASTICLISIIGGLQLLALGVIGEYVGKIYLESKHRPRYIIAQRTWDDPPR